MSDKTSRESNDSTGPSRRQVLATIGGVSGLAALAMGNSAPREADADGNLGIGGGAMADEMSNLLARVYSGTLAERDSAGVEGRLYVVYDPGEPEHGQVYRDTGDAWELEEREYSAISSEQGSIDSLHTGDAAITKDATIPEGVSIDGSVRSGVGPSSWSQSGPPLYKEHPKADNPVLTDNDVDDIANPTDVADVFARYDYGEGRYYAFFEVISDTEPIKTAYATSDDGLSWTYGGEVVDISQSYPMLFYWHSTRYICAGSGILFEENGFPTNWTKIESLQATMPNATATKDGTLFRHGGRWWFMAGVGSPTAEIGLWYSEETESAPDGLSWTEHPDSRFTGGAGTKKESPAGRPLVYDNAVDMFFMDDTSGSNYMSCFRYANIQTESGIRETETATSPVSSADLYAKDDAGGGKNHAIDHIVEGPTGGSPIVLMDVGTPWEIAVATTAESRVDKAVMSDTSGQDFDNGTWYIVDFDGQSVDYWGSKTTDGSGNDVLEFQSSGLYRVNARVKLGSVTDGVNVNFMIWNQDDTTLDWEETTVGATEDNRFHASYEGRFQKGDHVKARFRFDGDNTTLSTVTGVNNTRIEITRLD